VGDPRFANVVSVRLAQEHGRTRFLPLHRAEVLGVP